MCFKSGLRTKQECRICCELVFGFCRGFPNIRQVLALCEDLDLRPFICHFWLQRDFDTVGYIHNGFLCYTFNQPLFYHYNEPCVPLQLRLDI